MWAIKLIGLIWLGLTAGGSNQAEKKIPLTKASPTPVIIKVRPDNMEIKPVEATDGSDPILVSIPRIQLSAGIVAVGLNSEGLTDVPEENNKVSWYRLGPRPGQAGSAVLAGHYQLTNSPGVFHRLGELTVGDEVSTSNKEGQTVVFRVTRTEIYKVADFPLTEVYANGGSRKRLTLVTCNGRYNPKNQDYDKRLVVYAETI